MFLSGRVDLKLVRTLEDVNLIDWFDYVDPDYRDENYGWVRRIEYPVNCDDLDRVCSLSRMPGSKYRLGWSAGDLYVSKQHHVFERLSQ